MPLLKWLPYRQSNKLITPNFNSSWGLIVVCSTHSRFEQLDQNKNWFPLTINHRLISTSPPLFFTSNQIIRVRRGSQSLIVRLIKWAEAIQVYRIRAHLLKQDEGSFSKRRTENENNPSLSWLEWRNYVAYSTWKLFHKKGLRGYPYG